MLDPMFGTDGVRGVPGTYPLDPETVGRIGAATAYVLANDHPRLLVGRDTRASGPAIEAQLAQGVAATGGTLVSAGVLPTPAVALLTSTERFDAGVVVSASHNPYLDNGIKVLTADGEKASPELEARIEARVLDASWRVPETGSVAPEVVDLGARYVAHTSAVLEGAPPFTSRMAVDCANGAMSDVAPRLLRGLGLDVTPLNDVPDGRNINDGCGSTHMDPLRRMVAEGDFAMGLALDGDGDRVILVDDTGAMVDGDAMLLICARWMHASGRLAGHGVVATVMSNAGLEIALRAAGIAMHRCAVGDRQVRDAMITHGAVLGGEQSGHIIFSDLLPTGDGLVTALSVIRVMAETGRSLAELAADLETYPQVLVNVSVQAKPPIESVPAIAAAIRDAETALAGAGRVLVRYSGTEPLLRVMIEGKAGTDVHGLADAIATRVREHLG